MSDTSTEESVWSSDSDWNEPPHDDEEMHIAESSDVDTAESSSAFSTDDDEVDHQNVIDAADVEGNTEYTADRDYSSDSSGGGAHRGNVTSRGDNNNRTSRQEGDPSRRRADEGPRPPVPYRHPTTQGDDDGNAKEKPIASDVSGVTLSVKDLVRYTPAELVSRAWPLMSDDQKTQCFPPFRALPDPPSMKSRHLDLKEISVFLRCVAEEFESRGSSISPVALRTLLVQAAIQRESTLLRANTISNDVLSRAAEKISLAPHWEGAVDSSVEGESLQAMRQRYPRAASTPTEATSFDAAVAFHVAGSAATLSADVLFNLHCLVDGFSFGRHLLRGWGIDTLFGNLRGAIASHCASAAPADVANDCWLSLAFSLLLKLATASEESVRLLSVVALTLEHFEWLGNVELFGFPAGGPQAMRCFQELFSVLDGIVIPREICADVSPSSIMSPGISSTVLSLEHVLSELLQGAPVNGVFAVYSEPNSFVLFTGAGVMRVTQSMPITVSQWNKGLLLKPSDGVCGAVSPPSSDIIILITADVGKCLQVSKSTLEFVREIEAGPTNEPDALGRVADVDDALVGRWVYPHYLNTSRLPRLPFFSPATKQRGITLHPSDCVLPYALDAVTVQFSTMPLGIPRGTTFLKVLTIAESWVAVTMTISNYGLTIEFRHDGGASVAVRRHIGELSSWSTWAAVLSPQSGGQMAWKVFENGQPCSMHSIYSNSFGGESSLAAGQPIAFELLSGDYHGFLCGVEVYGTERNASTLMRKSIDPNYSPEVEEDDLPLISFRMEEGLGPLVVSRNSVFPVQWVATPPLEWRPASSPLRVTSMPLKHYLPISKHTAIAVGDEEMVLVDHQVTSRSAMTWHVSITTTVQRSTGVILSCFVDVLRRVADNAPPDQSPRGLQLLAANPLYYDSARQQWTKVVADVGVTIHRVAVDTRLDHLIPNAQGGETGPCCVKPFLQSLASLFAKVSTLPPSAQVFVARQPLLDSIHSPTAVCLPRSLFIAQLCVARLRDAPEDSAVALFANVLDAMLCMITKLMKCFATSCDAEVSNAVFEIVRQIPLLSPHLPNYNHCLITSEELRDTIVTRCVSEDQRLKLIFSSLRHHTAAPSTAASSSVDDGELLSLRKVATLLSADQVSSLIAGLTRDEKLAELRQLMGIMLQLCEQELDQLLRSSIGQSTTSDKALVEPSIILFNLLLSLIAHAVTDSQRLLVVEVIELVCQSTIQRVDRWRRASSLPNDVILDVLARSAFGIVAFSLVHVLTDLPMESVESSVSFVRRIGSLYHTVSSFAAPLVTSAGFGGAQLKPQISFTEKLTNRIEISGGKSAELSFTLPYATKVVLVFAFSLPSDASPEVVVDIISSRDNYAVSRQSLGAGESRLEILGGGDLNVCIANKRSQHTCTVSVVLEASVTVETTGDSWLMEMSRALSDATLTITTDMLITSVPKQVAIPLSAHSMFRSGLAPEALKKHEISSQPIWFDGDDVAELFKLYRAMVADVVGHPATVVWHSVLNKQFPEQQARRTKYERVLRHLTAALAWHSQPLRLPSTAEASSGAQASNVLAQFEEEIRAALRRWTSRHFVAVMEAKQQNQEDSICERCLFMMESLQPRLRVDQYVAEMQSTEEVFHSDSTGSKGSFHLIKAGSTSDATQLRAVESMRRENSALFHNSDSNRHSKKLIAAQHWAQRQQETQLDLQSRVASQVADFVLQGVVAYGESTDAVASTQTTKMIQVSIESIEETLVDRTVCARQHEAVYDAQKQLLSASLEQDKTLRSILHSCLQFRHRLSCGEASRASSSALAEGTAVRTEVYFMHPLLGCGTLLEASVQESACRMIGDILERCASADFGKGSVEVLQLAALLCHSWTGADLSKLNPEVLIHFMEQHLLPEESSPSSSKPSSPTAAPSSVLTPAGLSKASPLDSLGLIASTPLVLPNTVRSNGVEGLSLPTMNDELGFGFQIEGSDLYLSAQFPWIDAGCRAAPPPIYSAHQLKAIKEIDVFYFEMTLLLCVQDTFPGGSIGLATTSVNATRSNIDGLIAAMDHKGEVEGKPMCSPWKVSDVIGCGFISSSRRIFFTKNGVFLGTVAKEQHTLECPVLYPVFSVHGKNSVVTVSVNFGEKSKFRFDFLQLSRSRQIVQATPLMVQHAAFFSLQYIATLCLNTLKEEEEDRGCGTTAREAASNQLEMISKSVRKCVRAHLFVMHDLAATEKTDNTPLLMLLLRTLNVLIDCCAFDVLTATTHLCVLETLCLLLRAPASLPTSIRIRAVAGLKTFLTKLRPDALGDAARAVRAVMDEHALCSTMIALATKEEADPGTVEATVSYKWSSGSESLRVRGVTFASTPLPKKGVNRVGFRIRRTGQRQGVGSPLGGCYYVGLSIGRPTEVTAMTNMLQRPDFFVLQDTDDSDQVKHIRLPVNNIPRNAHRRIFGNDEVVWVERDSQTGNITFYREEHLIGVAFVDTPRTGDYFPVVLLYNEDASCELLSPSEVASKGKKEVTGDALLRSYATECLQSMHVNAFFSEYISSFVRDSIRNVRSLGGERTLESDGPSERTRILANALTALGILGGARSFSRCKHEGYGSVVVHDIAGGNCKVFLDNDMDETLFHVPLAVLQPMFVTPHIARLAEISPVLMQEATQCAAVVSQEVYSILFAVTSIDPLQTVETEEREAIHQQWEQTQEMLISDLVGLLRCTIEASVLPPSTHQTCRFVARKTANSAKGGESSCPVVFNRSLKPRDAFFASPSVVSVDTDDKTPASLSKRSDVLYALHGLPLATIFDESRQQCQFTVQVGSQSKQGGRLNTYVGVSSGPVGCPKFTVSAEAIRLDEHVFALCDYDSAGTNCSTCLLAPNTIFNSTQLFVAGDLIRVTVNVSTRRVCIDRIRKGKEVTFGDLFELPHNDLNALLPFVATSAGSTLVMLNTDGSFPIRNAIPPLIAPNRRAPTSAVTCGWCADVVKSNSCDVDDESLTPLAFESKVKDTRVNLCPTCFANWVHPSALFYPLYSNQGQIESKRYVVSRHCPKSLTEGALVEVEDTPFVRWSSIKSANTAFIGSDAVAIAEHAVASTEAVPPLGEARLDFTIQHVASIEGRPLAGVREFLPKWRGARSVVDSGRCTSRVNQNSRLFSSSPIAAQSRMWLSFSYEEHNVGSPRQSVIIGVTYDDPSAHGDKVSSLEMQKKLNRSFWGMSFDSRRLKAGERVYFLIDTCAGSMVFARSLEALYAKPDPEIKIPLGRPLFVAAYTSDDATLVLHAGQKETSSGSWPACPPALMPSTSSEVPELLPSTTLSEVLTLTRTDTEYFPVMATNTPCIGFGVGLADSIVTGPMSMDVVSLTTDNIEQARVDGWSTTSFFGTLSPFRAGCAVTVGRSHDGVLLVYVDGLLICTRPLPSTMINKSLRFFVFASRVGVAFSMIAPLYGTTRLGRVTRSFGSAAVLRLDNDTTTVVHRKDVRFCGLPPTKATSNVVYVNHRVSEVPQRGILAEMTSTSTSIRRPNDETGETISGIPLHCIFDTENEDTSSVPRPLHSTVNQSAEIQDFAFDVGLSKYRKSSNGSYNGIMFDCICNCDVELRGLDVQTQSNGQYKCDVFFLNSSHVGQERQEKSWTSVCRKSVVMKQGERFAVDFDRPIRIASNQTFALYINTSHNCGVGFFTEEDDCRGDVGAVIDTDGRFTVMMGKKSENATNFSDIPNAGRGFCGRIRYSSSAEYKEPHVAEVPPVATENEIANEVDELHCCPTATMLESCVTTMIRVQHDDCVSLKRATLNVFTAVPALQRPMSDALVTITLQQVDECDSSPTRTLDGSRLLCCRSVSFEDEVTEVVVPIEGARLIKGSYRLTAALQASSCSAQTSLATARTDHTVTSASRDIELVGKWCGSLLFSRPITVDSTKQALREFSTGSSFTSGTASYNGIMFDVVSNVDVEVEEVHFVSQTTSSNVTLKFYYRQGGMRGYEKSPQDWTLLSSTTTSLVDAEPFTPGKVSVRLNAGQRTAFYLNTSSSCGVRFFSGSDGPLGAVGDMFDHDDTITVFVGRKSESVSPFQDIPAEPRGFRGKLLYRHAPTQRKSTAEEGRISIQRGYLATRMLLALNALSWGSPLILSELRLLKRSISQLAIAGHHAVQRSSNANEWSDEELSTLDAMESSLVRDYEHISAAERSKASVSLALSSNPTGGPSSGGFWRCLEKGDVAVDTKESRLVAVLEPPHVDSNGQLTVKVADGVCKTAHEYLLAGDLIPLPKCVNCGGAIPAMTTNSEEDRNGRPRSNSGHSTKSHATSVHDDRTSTAPTQSSPPRQALICGCRELLPANSQSGLIGVLKNTFVQRFSSTADHAELAATEIVCHGKSIEEFFDEDSDGGIVANNNGCIAPTKKCSTLTRREDNSLSSFESPDKSCVHFELPIQILEEIERRESLLLPDTTATPLRLAFPPVVHKGIFFTLLISFDKTVSVSLMTDASLRCSAADATECIRVGFCITADADRSYHEVEVPHLISAHSPTTVTLTTTLKPLHLTTYQRAGDVCRLTCTIERNSPLPMALEKLSDSACSATRCWRSWRIADYPSKSSASSTTCEVANKKTMIQFDENLKEQCVRRSAFFVQCTDSTVQLSFFFATNNQKSFRSVDELMSSSEEVRHCQISIQVREPHLIHFTPEDGLIVFAWGSNQMALHRKVDSADAQTLYLALTSITSKATLVFWEPPVGPLNRVHRLRGATKGSGNGSVALSAASFVWTRFSSEQTRRDDGDRRIACSPTCSGQIAIGPVLPKTGWTSFTITIRRSDKRDGEPLGGGHYAGVASPSFTNFTAHYQVVCKETGKIFAVQDVQDGDSQPTQLRNPNVSKDQFLSGTELTFTVDHERGTLSMSRDGEPPFVYFANIPPGMELAPFVRIDNAEANAVLGFRSMGNSAAVPNESADDLTDDAAINLRCPPKELLLSRSFDSIRHKHPLFAAGASVLSKPLLKRWSDWWARCGSYSSRDEVLMHKSLDEMIYVHHVFAPNALPDLLDGGCSSFESACLRMSQLFVVDAAPLTPCTMTVGCFAVGIPCEYEVSKSPTPIAMQHTSPYFEAVLLSSFLSGAMVPSTLLLVDATHDGVMNPTDTFEVDPHPLIVGMCDRLTNVVFSTPRPEGNVPIGLILKGFSLHCTLADVFQKQIPLSELQRMSILSSLWCALEHYHLQGQIHGHIHSGNILLQFSNDVEAVTVKLWSAARMVPGAPWYLHHSSPESLKWGERSFYSDIWACGIVSRQLLMPKYEALVDYESDSTCGEQQNALIYLSLLESVEEGESYLSVADRTRILSTVTNPDVVDPVTRMLSVDLVSRGDLSAHITASKILMDPCDKNSSVSEIQEETFRTGRSPMRGGTGSYNGIMFDVVAKQKTVRIKRIVFVPDTSSAVVVRLFTRKGTFLGFESLSSEWTKVLQKQQRLQDGQEMTLDGFPPIEILAGQRAAIFLHTESSSGVLFYSESDGVSAEIGDIQEEDDMIGVTVGKKSENSTPFNGIQPQKRYLRGGLIYEVALDVDERRSKLSSTKRRPEAVAQATEPFGRRYCTVAAMQDPLLEEGAEGTHTGLIRGNDKLVLFDNGVKALISAGALSAMADCASKEKVLNSDPAVFQRPLYSSNGCAWVNPQVCGRRPMKWSVAQDDYKTVLLEQNATMKLSHIQLSEVFTLSEGVLECDKDVGLSEPIMSTTILRLKVTTSSSTADVVAKVGISVGGKPPRGFYNVTKRFCQNGEEPPTSTAILFVNNLTRTVSMYESHRTRHGMDFTAPVMLASNFAELSPASPVTVVVVPADYGEHVQGEDEGHQAVKAPVVRCRLVSTQNNNSTSIIACGDSLVGLWKLPLEVLEHKDRFLVTAYRDVLFNAEYCPSSDENIADHVAIHAFQAAHVYSKVRTVRIRLASPDLSDIECFTMKVAARQAELSGDSVDTFGAVSTVNIPLPLQHGTHLILQVEVDEDQLVSVHQQPRMFCRLREVSVLTKGQGLEVLPDGDGVQVRDLGSEGGSKPSIAMFSPRIESNLHCVDITLYLRDINDISFTLRSAANATTKSPFHELLNPEEKGTLSRMDVWGVARDERVQYANMAKFFYTRMSRRSVRITFDTQSGRWYSSMEGAPTLSGILPTILPFELHLELTGIGTIAKVEEWRVLDVSAKNSPSGELWDRTAEFFGKHHITVSPFVVMDSGVVTRHSEKPRQRIAAQFSVATAHSVASLCQEHLYFSSRELLSTLLFSSGAEVNPADALSILSTFSTRQLQRALYAVQAFSPDAARRTCALLLHEVLLCLQVPTVDSKRIIPCISILRFFLSSPVMERVMKHELISPSLVVVLLRIATAQTRSIRHETLRLLSWMVSNGCPLPTTSVLNAAALPLVKMFHGLSLRAAEQQRNTSSESNSRYDKALIQLGLDLLSNIADRFVAEGMTTQIPGIGSSVPFPLILCCRTVLSAMNSNPPKPIPKSALMLVERHIITSAVEEMPPVEAGGSVLRPVRGVFTESFHMDIGLRYFECHVKGSRNGVVAVGWDMDFPPNQAKPYSEANALTYPVCGVVIRPDGDISLCANRTVEKTLFVVPHSEEILIGVLCDYGAKCVRILVQCGERNTEKTFTTVQHEFITVPMYMFEDASDAELRVSRESWTIRRTPTINGAVLNTIDDTIIASLKQSLTTCLLVELQDESGGGQGLGIGITPQRMEFYLQLNEMLDNIDETVLQAIRNAQQVRIPSSELVAYPLVSEYVTATAVGSLAGSEDPDVAATEVAIDCLLPFTRVLLAVDILTVELSKLISLRHQIPTMFQLFSQLKPLCGREARERIHQHALKPYTGRSGMRQEVTIHTAKALPTLRKGEGATLQSSIFGQLHHQLCSAPDSTFYATPMFHVKLAGFGAQDAGGPYREVLSLLAQEIMCTHPSGQFQMNPLFIPVQKSGGNDENDTVVMPNPLMTLSSQTVLQLEFFGKLLAFFLTTSDVLAVDFPPLFWKVLLQQPVSRNDLRQMDENFFQNCAAGELSEKRLPELEERYPGITSAWTERKEALTLLTASPEVPNAAVVHCSAVATLTEAEDAQCSATSVPQTPVVVAPGTFDDEIPRNFNVGEEMLECIVDLELHRYDNAIESIRDGFCRIIPLHVLQSLYWKDIHRCVCGEPLLTVEALRKQTNVELPKHSADMFWTVVTDLSPKDRCLLLKFSTGQSRLPLKQPLRVKADSGRNDALPTSSTCFFTLQLPSYSSLRLMRERILYAIRQCNAIDRDGNAHEALAMAVE